MATQHQRVQQHEQNHDAPPNIEAQRQIIGKNLKQALKRGNIRYLVSARWLNQWRAHVGPPPCAVHPGPIDNSDLLDPASAMASKEFSITIATNEDSQSVLFCSINAYQLKNHLSEDKDYAHVPESVWNMLVQWYGMTVRSRPIMRGVIEHGGSTWLELYPAKLQLHLYPHMQDHTELVFSEVHTVGFLERVMRVVFRIGDDVTCRVWCKGTERSDAFWMLPVPNKHIKSVLDSEKIIVIQTRNQNGSWPGAPDFYSRRTFPPLLVAPRTCDEVLSILNQTHSPPSLSGSYCEVPPYTEAMPPDSTIVYTQQLVELRRQLVKAERRASDAGEQLSQAQHQAVEADGRADRAETLIRELLDETQRGSKEQVAKFKQHADEAWQQADEAWQQANKFRQQAEEARRQAEEARRETVQKMELEIAKAMQQATQSRQEADEARQQADEARQQADEARQQADEARQQADEARQQADEARQQADEALQRADRMESDLRSAEHRLSTSDQVFQDVLQRLMGHIPQSQPFWVVGREEITLTEEVIGAGAWAAIKVAIFRGQRVAAKCLHQQIISAHNIRLFTREMNMAAQARHPNLLQFMGAVMEGTPIILTELLPTSLRRVLEQGTRLTHRQIITISSEVGRALNYLHLTTPDPIVHRDISSANVLLEPQGESWKAKVSDYGSANFVRYTTTAGPGNFLYAAPEAGDPKRHSPKMDVYSFGVLLVEMVTGELPDSLEELIQTRVNVWPEMVLIVRRCTHREPLRRPDMSELVTDLTELNVD